jgi:tetratricopeptide (TPR) repeat protein
MRLGRSAEALDAFDTAHRLGSRSSSSLFWSGRLKCDAGRWTEAADDLRAALDLDPDLTPARNALARALAEIEREDGP